MSYPAASSLLAFVGLVAFGLQPLTAATQTASVNFTINHGATVSTGSVSILGSKSGTGTSGPGTVSLPQFNPAAGTLTSAEISISTTASTAGVAKTGLLSLLTGAGYDAALRADVTAGTVTRSGQNIGSTASASLLSLLNLGGALSRPAGLRLIPLSASRIRLNWLPLSEREALPPLSRRPIRLISTRSPQC